MWNGSGALRRPARKVGAHGKTLARRTRRTIADGYCAKGPSRNLDTTVMIISDSDGLSTATSTLGCPYKYPGRVGDGARWRTRSAGRSTRRSALPRSPRCRARSRSPRPRIYVQGPRQRQRHRPVPPHADTGIPQHSHPRCAWRDLLEHFQPFCAKTEFETREAGGVVSRAGDARDRAPGSSRQPARTRSV